MKIAALYDIHANLPALEAVLAEISRLHVDLVIVGGDVVAGPLPNASLAALRDISIETQFIRGNVESELLRLLAGQAPGGLSPRADQEAVWLDGVLSAENKQFVGTWLQSFTMTGDEFGRILFCHATPTSDIRVFTERTPDAQMPADFGSTDANLVICGHTHMQFDRQFGDVRIVNAGSVGMPFDAVGAHWFLIDGDVLTFKRTSYDLALAAERIRQSGYPSAEQFITDNLLQVPSAEVAHQFLAAIEAKQLGH